MHRLDPFGAMEETDEENLQQRVYAQMTFGKEATATEPLGIQIRNRVPMCPEIFDRSIDFRSRLSLLPVLSRRFAFRYKDGNSKPWPLSGVFSRLDLRVEWVALRVVTKHLGALDFYTSVPPDTLVIVFSLSLLLKGYEEGKPPSGTKPTPARTVRCPVAPPAL